MSYFDQWWQQWAEANAESCKNAPRTTDTAPDGVSEVLEPSGSRAVPQPENAAAFRRWADAHIRFWFNQQEEGDAG